jgi:hypothetical protein
VINQPKISLIDELKNKTNTLSKPKEEEKEKKLDSIFDSDPTLDDIFNSQKSMIPYCFKLIN